MKSPTAWANLYHDGQVQGAEDLREMARALILYGDNLQVSWGIEIYKSDLEEPVDPELLLASAERNRNRKDGSSVHCYKEVVRGMDRSDRQTGKKVVEGLDCLREAATIAEVSSEDYYEDIQMCQKWVQRKLNPNYDAENQGADWIKRFDHGQVETVDELRMAAQEMVRRGDFRDALSIYLLELEEQIPLDLLLESAENGMDIYSGFSIPRYGAAISVMDPHDTQTARRIETGLRLLKAKLEAFGNDKRDPDTLGIEECEKWLKAKQDPNYIESEWPLNSLETLNRYGFLTEKEDLRRLAEYHLSEFEFEEAMKIYRRFVGEEPSEDLLLEVAERSSISGNSTFATKCYYYIRKIKSLDAESAEMLGKPRKERDVEKILEMRRRNVGQETVVSDVKETEQSGEVNRKPFFSRAWSFVFGSPIRNSNSAKFSGKVKAQ